MAKIADLYKTIEHIVPSYKSLSYNDFLNQFFKASSTLTDKYPKAGSYVLDKSIGFSVGSKILLRHEIKKCIRQLETINKFDKMLVVGDLNIGDALNIQSVIYALKDFFPNSQIDYIANPIAKNLIDMNPNISNVWSFLNTSVEDDNNFNILKSVANKSYDLILNLCPFFTDNFFKTIVPKNIALNLSNAMTSLLVYNEKNNVKKNHITYQMHNLIYKLFEEITKQKPKVDFKGIDITIKENAVSKACDFIEKLKIKTPFIIYNPDATSRFTRIPLNQQISILKYLADSEDIESILLGSGHVKKGIEFEIFEALDKKQKSKIVIIPASMPLDVYSALIDLSGVFITPDTGPLHIAAARKHTDSKLYLPKNKTAVISIFGATPAKIYGYDSENPLFFDTNQDAPSKTYIAESMCRNLTCINKNAKTCKNVRCFESIDTKKVANDAVNYIIGV
jgi:ADP-heptose:LPS heptosyltransferase